jgi:hypothetical protein
VKWKSCGNYAIGRVEVYVEYREVKYSGTSIGEACFYGLVDSCQA